MTARVLVAGIGNLFLGDDGFGPEVVRRLLAGDPLPAGVRVTDYGIRGMHLAFDLLDPYDAVILVDALPGEGQAGLVEVLRVTGVPDGRDLDGHQMDPAAVLAAVVRLGGTVPDTYVVGCRVATVGEGIGLSAPVAAAVPAAAATVRALTASVAGAGGG
ncbi:peptidase M52 [Actinoplanes ianthinogenes]|uniref:Peptidase M52 n=1 Tax=Actinoplanes ianthinogenes TaxID=122358 RepID=A0ABN6CP40_9ACTN|nr:hydrogenase maturation protease [Actinoplanes ianthinogenes]BCJ45917.1 peptidase M52 [Actinoplanes ianthinogenes]GGR31152.1 peptidase M52 [Actinoplanes ianthinogenes]